MASIIYDSFMTDLNEGNIDPATDTYYVMLLTSSYTPSKAHAKRSDVDADETSGTGYTAGGQASACTIIPNGGSNYLDLNFADVSWTGASFSAAYGVIYKHRGGADTADNLVACVDFGGTVTISGGTFTFHTTSNLRFQN